MALTPAPVPGNTIMATWGTEIRNRTVQVFANTAEIDAWAAPNGAIAANLATSRLHVRIAGVWRIRNGVNSGFSTVTTNAQSDATIAHGLGFVPTCIVCTPSHETNANTAMIQITAKTISNFTVRVRNYNGVGQADTQVGIHWMTTI